MKYLILLILLNTYANYCQSREYFTDMDNDKDVDSVKIYSENNTTFIKCNNSIVDLGAVSLNPVIRTDSSIVDFLLVDFNNDSTKEIVLSTDHPIFANKTILYFLSYKDSVLEKMNVDFGSNKTYDHIIVLDRIALFDDCNSNFYCKVGNIGFNHIDGNTVFYEKIILIKWDQYLSGLILAGEKYFLNIENEEFKEIVF